MRYLILVCILLLVGCTKTTITGVVERCYIPQTVWESTDAITLVIDSTRTNCKIQSNE